MRMDDPEGGLDGVLSKGMKVELRGTEVGIRG
jgi:hypothetical protein